MAGPVVVRFYPEARSAHLERADAMAASTTFYFVERSDFDQELARARRDFVRTTLRGLLSAIRRQVPDVVEVPEPLWFRFLPHALVVGLWARAVGRLHGRRVAVVAYAIENAGPDRVPRPLARLPRFVWAVGQRVAARTGVRALDRLVFGTDGARDAYEACLSARGRARLAARSTVLTALPVPCDCPPAGREPGRVLFLGSLEQRKGFDLVARAWPAVAGPARSLRIVGDGPLRAVVDELLRRDRSASWTRDATRADVHAELRRAEVLVLPSQGGGRWREQVGLPVVEGLAHGCRVVTTTETGLAEALRRARHVVLPAPTTAEDVAAGIDRALESGLTPEDVTGALPDEDGRVGADRLLMEGW